MSAFFLYSIDYKISHDTTTILTFEEYPDDSVKLTKRYTLERISEYDLDRALAKLISSIPINPVTAKKPVYRFVKTAYFWEINSTFLPDTSNCVLTNEQLEIAFKKYFQLDRNGQLIIETPEVGESIEKFNGEYQSLNSQARAFLAAMHWFDKVGFRTGTIY